MRKEAVRTTAAPRRKTRPLGVSSIWVSFRETGRRSSPLRSARASRRFTITSRASTVTKSRVDTALISGVTRFFVMP